MSITEDERKKILDQNFPDTVLGYKRPGNVPTDFPYSENFPQFIAKDKVIYTLTNLIVRQLISNDKYIKALLESSDKALKEAQEAGDKQLKALIDSLSNRLTNNDLSLVTQNLKGLMSPEDKKKLDGIAYSANNYSHPNSGVSAGTYKQVTVNAQGHVTKGTNPTTLAGFGITDAANKVHGNHVPTTESANNARFLRNDNTWQTVTPSNIGAPTKTGSGASGTWGINISGKATTAGTADTAKAIAWSAVTNKPSTYPPATHNHDSSYPSQTGARASGTWGINISGTATTATKAVDSDKLDGYHYADIVKNLAVNYGKTTPTITPLVDWDTMSTKFGYNPIRIDWSYSRNGVTVTQNIPACHNIRTSGEGIHAYGGDNSVSGLENGDIILKEDYRNYDRLLVAFTNDAGDVSLYHTVETWLLNYMMTNYIWKIPLAFYHQDYWEITGYTDRGSNTHRVSTPTIFRGAKQNCGIIEIYGIKY